MKYDTKKIKDIANLNMGQSPLSKFYNNDGNGIVFLQGARTFGRMYPKFDTYTTEYNKVAERGDILISVRAPVGEVNLAPTKVAIGRGVASITPKDNISGDYLYYLLRTIGNSMNYSSNGTVFNSINKKEILNTKVKVILGKDEQEKVAYKLKLLDKKINLNNKINSRLLKLSKLLYEKYSSTGTFSKKSIKELSSKIVTGKTPSTKNLSNYGTDVPFITIPDMHDEVFTIKTQKMLSKIGADSQKNKYLPPFSINVSSIGTPGLVTINPVLSQTNQQINNIIIDKAYIWYVYLAFDSLKEYIRNLGSGGSTILNLNKKDFSNIQIKWPSNDIDLKNFNDKLRPIFMKILNNQEENKSLSKMEKVLTNKYFNN